VRSNLHIHLQFEAEVRLDTIKEFSSYLKENTTLHHYINQVVNAVQGNNRSLYRESYRTHKYEMQELLNVKVAGTYSYHSALKG
jgi:hypothetical protein